MNLLRLGLTSVLFAVFVPGVWFRLPVGNKWVVLALHGALFAIVLQLVLRYSEGFGNYGPTCPNGFSGPDCTPVGHQTYSLP